MWYSFHDSLKISLSILMAVLIVANVYASWTGTPDQLTWGGNGGDYSQGIVKDDAGDLYIGGYTFTFGYSFMDVFLVKFNRSGDVIWSKLWYPDPDSDNRLLDLEYSDGVVYGAGYFSISGFYGFLIGVDTNGNLVCEEIFDYNNSLRAKGLHTLNNSISIVGSIAGNKYFGWVSYLENCLPLWQAILDPIGNVSLELVDTYIGDKIYIVGVIERGSNKDLFIGYMDPSGSLIDYRVYDISVEDIPKDILIDGMGDILVSGYTSNGINTSNILLMKLSPSLNLIWSEEIYIGQWSEGYDVAVDSFNNIFQAGRISIGSQSDSILLEFNDMGQFYSGYRYDHPDWDEAKDLVVENIGGNTSKYITGFLSNSMPYPWIPINASVYNVSPIQVNISINLQITNATTVNFNTSFIDIYGVLNNPSIPEAYIVYLNQPYIIDEFSGYTSLIVAVLIPFYIYIRKFLKRI